MGSQLDVYCKVVHNDYDSERHVLWPAVSGGALGDYGTMDGKRFVRVGNLLEHESWWDHQPGVNGGTYASKIDFTSDGAVDVAISAKAYGVRVTLDFDRDNAAIFQAQQAKYHRFEDYDHIGKVVKQRDDAGRWDADWVVVMETITAGKVFAACSTAKNTQMTLEYEGSENPDSANDLAGLELGVVSKDADTATWAAPKGSSRDTPVLAVLYRLRKPAGGARSFEAL